MKTDALLKLQNKTTEGCHCIALLLLVLQLELAGNMAGAAAASRLICTQTNAIKCKEKCKKCGKAFATPQPTYLHQRALIALTATLISSGENSKTNNNIRTK